MGTFENCVCTPTAKGYGDPTSNVMMMEEKLEKDRLVCILCMSFIVQASIIVGCQTAIVNFLL